MKKYISRAMWSAGIGVALWCGYSKVSSMFPEEELVPATMIGVHHMGPHYLVTDFYVNKYWGGGAQRTGGGGGEVCCLMLPSSWRPDLVVEVRWEVEDESQENREEVAAGNFQSIIIRRYIAKVPVEKYSEPGDVYVHFFPRGRVRVVSTMFAPSNPYHPVLHGLLADDPKATAGRPIKELFTQAELDETDKRRGGWR